MRSSRWQDIMSGVGEMPRSPAGKERGISCGLASHYSSWGFVVSKSEGDLTTGPGVVGGFATSLAGLFITSASVPYLQYRKLTQEFLSYNKQWSRGVDTAPHVVEIPSQGS